MRFAVYVVLISTIVPAATSTACAAAKAEWTIMVFMNGKNNLEEAALSNFAQLANVGSSDQVNVVAELGRPAKVRHTRLEGNWTGVLRFHVEKEMHPLPERAIDPDNPAVRKADMGDPKTLSDFIVWSKAHFAANRYMLLIWNHGQGWRLQLSSAARATSARALSPRVKAVSNNGRSPSASSPDKSILGGYRAVSYDDDTNNFLYNREIAESLTGDEVDVIGFDACLMDMVETAYALRKTARLLVASEELVPNDGWPYDKWLGALEMNPKSNEKDLGKILVDSYKDHYKDAAYTTLAAIDLSKTSQLANAISSLAILLKTHTSESANVYAARSSLLNYGDWYGDSWAKCGHARVIRFHGVDLGAFVDGLQSKSGNESIKQSASLVKTLINQMTLSNYASAPAQAYGSTGMAIYFPASKTDYECDTDGKAYDPVKARHGDIEEVPEFVVDTQWPDFVQSYIQLHP